jgi:hypothetical protein
VILHERDPRTGRPVDEGREVAASALTDNELVEELAIAASAPGRSRIDRYQALLHELVQRRRRNPSPSLPE